MEQTEIHVFLDKFAENVLILAHLSFWQMSQIMSYSSTDYFQYLNT